ncbi:MAG: sigma-70 family RNA polymerase sigma factor [Bacteroidota bacterium]|nr:sigma-70 family RNA polymerase sigma factor [Bacteroidota bacterium]
MPSRIVKKAEYIMIQTGDDNEWLARFRQGDEAIFREVYETHKVAIYSYSLKLLNYNVSEAEDMTALAFVRLWENLENIESLDHIKAFLFMVARNAIANHYVRNKRRRNVFRDVKSISTEVEESAIDFERMHAEMISQLMNEIEELPERNREIFKMHFFGKKSGKEIASALGISEASVSREKNSAQNTLKSTLLRKGLVATITYLLYLLPIH